MKLQKLTVRGMKKLESDLEEIRQKKTSDKINIRNYESEEIKNINIDGNKRFDDKLSVGKYFLHVFPDDFQPCKGTWNWLSILYHRQLLNAHEKIGDLGRIFISENYTRYPYRHLLKAPYDICKFYKNYKNEQNCLEEVCFLLKDKVNKNGVFYKQIAENQDIRKNLKFMRVAKQLFYDKETKSIKKNITDPIQRLIKVWKQYERSFDMYRMPGETVINKLLVKHEEFSKFISR